VIDAGSCPWAHTKVNGIDKSKGVKPEYGRIDPAIHRDKRGVELGGLASRGRYSGD